MLRAAKNALAVEYAIRDVVLHARAVEAEGHEVLKLNIGDPCAYDFDTPQHMKDAVAKAMKDGENGYGPSEGLVPLRQAVAEREKKRNDVTYGLEDMCVTHGVTESLSMLYGSVLNPGDEVLVPGPAYPPYASLARLFHAKPISFRCIEEENWQPDLDDVRRRITDRTRMICLINPNNPTGAMWGRRVIQGLGGIAGEYAKQLFLVSDEIYDDMAFDAKHHATANLVKDVPVVTFNGLSKIHLAPGWRIGWTMFRDVDGRLEEIKRAYLNQARLRLCASSIAQRGALAALTGPQDHVPKTVETLRRRRDITVSRLNEIEGLSVTKPEGAFYAFPKIEALDYPGTPWRNDKDFVLDLLRTAHVLTVHGSGFDPVFGTGHFRTVILPDEDTLDRSFKAIEKFMKKRLKKVEAS